MFTDQNERRDSKRTSHLESIIKDQVAGYIDRNNILSSHQHGFVKHRSCLSNILETLETWTDALDNGYRVVESSVSPLTI